jgi:DNA-binding transcriptional MocR family regulator
MAALGVGPVTVRRAVAHLVAEGLLTTRPGTGTFVARPARRPTSDTAWQQVALGDSPVDPAGLDVAVRMRDAGAVPLATGYPAEPLRTDGRVAAALARAARRPGAWDPPPPMGIRELRSWFGHEIGVDPDDVLIVPGGQAALSATVRAVVPSGSPVLFETPTYPGALAVARSAGLVPVPVPVDRDGVRPDLLERAFATTGARLLYMQPTYANPDGRVLAQERRGDVLAVAAAAGAFVVEDDWARWLSYGPVPPPPLIRDDADGHVITLTSLTKTIAPSLRVGAVAARGPVLQRVAAMRLVDDHFMSRPLQEAAVDLVTSAGWPSHLRTLRAGLRERVDVMAVALARHLPECRFVVPEGGLSIWLELPAGVDDLEATDRALTAGAAVLPGRIFEVGEAEPAHLRLSFAATEPRLIERGVEALARSLPVLLSGDGHRRR